MTRRALLWSILTLLPSCLLAPTVRGQAEQESSAITADGSFQAAGKKIYRPHILFVVMDDIGSADLGYHGSGIQTPVADGLAKSGLRLTSFYTLPTCTTTRAALQTGRYPYRMGLYAVIRTRSTIAMPTNEETIPQVLKTVGYQTHAVGKWHLGHAKWEQTPTFRGYQSFFGFHVAGVQDDQFDHTRLGKYEMWQAQGENCGEGCSEYFQAEGVYSSFLYADGTKRIIKRYKEEDGPLFIYLAFQAVHTPLQAPEKYIKMYKNQKDWNDEKKLYAGYLTAADVALGTVIDALKEYRLWQDTLVIYQTDNGASGQRGVPSSNGVSRGGKQDIWEGGVLGEAFISGPARSKLKIRSGKHKTVMHTVDWLPTLASITGANSSGILPLDGVDQWKALKGGKSSRDLLFLGYSASDKQFGRYGSKDNYTAVRYGRWKLVRDPDFKTYYLYNLDNDPGEQDDLSSQQKKIVRYLKRKMKQYEKDFAEPQPFKDRSCPKVTYGKTPWGQPAWQPWC